MHPTGPLRRRIISPTLAYIIFVPSVLRVKMMRMAVVRLQSSSGLWCGLNDPFDIHSSRTAIATVRIRRFVCIFAKRMSPRWSLAGLTRVSNDIEDGLFIAARAFSNVQSAICYGMEGELAVRTRAYLDAGMNRQRMAWRAPAACLEHVNKGIGNTQ